MESIKLTFSFDKLDEVRRQVEVAHPHIEETIAELSESHVERILRILKRSSLDTIPKIARGLNREERFASVYAYVAASTAELQEKVAMLLTSVARKEHISAGWQVAIHHCSTVGYLETIRNVAIKVKAAFPDFAEGRPSGILSRLLSEDPFGEIIVELEESKASVHSWMDNEQTLGTKIPKDSEFAKRVYLALLTQGTGETIQLNHIDEIRAWSLDFREIDYQRFGVHYLTIFEPQTWASIIVDDILAKYGLPAGGHAFWRRVPEKARIAFQRMIAGQKLNEFFDGVYDPDKRFAFWKKFIDYFTDLEFPRSKEHLFMAFGNFGVVEFRDVGNAAYFYKKNDFEWVKDLIGQDNNMLKNMNKKFYRLIHREGWRHDMKAKMTGFLAGRI